MSIAIHRIERGYVVSENESWLPGVFATEKAARMGAALPCEVLEDLWLKIGFHENGNADGSTDYLLTETDIKRKDME